MKDQLLTQEEITEIIKDATTLAAQIIVNRISVERLVYSVMSSPAIREYISIASANSDGVERLHDLIKESVFSSFNECFAKELDHEYGAGASFDDAYNENVFTVRN